MKFERFKNYGFWVSLFSLIGLLLHDFGGINFSSARYELYVQTILSILVVLGIANDPNTGKWYKD